MTEEERKETAPAEKKCSRCKEVKPLDAFSPRKNGPQGRQSSCKACAAEDQRSRYRRDPLAVLERAERWRKENPERVKELSEKHRQKNIARNLLDSRRRPEIWAARRA